MAELELEDDPEVESADEKPEPKVALGTYSPFDVSDQQLMTRETLDSEAPKLALPENIRALVVAACQRESLGRRLEVERAWQLQLKDRGFHRLLNRSGGGWELPGQWKSSGVYGWSEAHNYHDLNIIGAHNDIIVNALCRDIPKTEFTPKSDDDQAVTAAAAANKIKWFIQEDACYKQAQALIGRTFCTDERSVAFMRPVADAQTWGFEDDSDDVVPETEEDTPPGKPTKTPKIQTVLSIFGKLEHKSQIAIDRDDMSPYQLIATEEDTASMRAEFPWIKDKIEGGSAGIAEIELDRVARQSIKLAIQSGQQTGQGGTNDTTKLRAWISPKFYWDAACKEDARQWLLENFPKGFLAVYAGVELAFVRNESWSEVLTVMHARTGKGQNRRALTEAFSGPNTILNNWMDLLDKFFTATVPKVFLDATAFNVPALRASGNDVGRYEPFNSAKVPTGTNPMLLMPMPTHQPALPTFIQWLAGPLAEVLTGAQLTLQGKQGETDQTLGEAEMDSDAANTRLSEPWAAMCKGFSNITRQAVQWNARVQPADKVFDRVIGQEGRLRVEMQQIDTEVLAVAETDTNFPESWSEREEKVWQLINQMPTNQFIATIMMNPANARIIKDAARMGLEIAGAASWEKQEGEFTVLMAGQPQPNPQVQQIQAQIAQLRQHMEQGAQDVQQRQQAGQPVDPQEIQMLEQGLQTIQQLTQQMQCLPPLISSVSVRADGSEEDAIEQACCLQKMISADGRRMASSKAPQEQAAFANLHLHWMEHKTAAAALAKKNEEPVEPKASVTLAIDKMPPAVQSELLGKLGIASDPSTFESMGPHEITHEVEGVNETGAKEKITTSLVGKSLN